MGGRWTRCPTCGNDWGGHSIYRCDDCGKIFCFECMRAEPTFFGGSKLMCPHCDSRVYTIIGEID